MSRTVNIHAAKTQLSKLIQRVCQGEEIVIAKHGKPIARLVPAKPGKKRTPGRIRGLVVPDAFFHSLPKDELKAWEYAH